MPTNKATVSVRLDESAARRVERAAKLARRSLGSFLGQVGDEAATRLLLEHAVSRHRAGERSFSELAAETGLAVEQVMTAVGAAEADAAEEMFLASCRSIAEATGDHRFAELGAEALRVGRAARAIDRRPIQA